MLGDLETSAANESRRVCPNIEIRPHYISRHEETDAIRYWVESLEGEGDIESEGDAVPNLFVVRLRTKRDAMEAEKIITAKELKHQLDGTPVIAISESNTLTLTEVISSTREARLLTTPFTIDEFERCVRSIPELEQQAQAAA